MTNSTNCDELQQLSALEALGALEPEDAARLREHWAANAEARRDFGRFLDTAAALAGLVPLSRPSPELRGRILERIRRTPQRGGGWAGTEGAGAEGTRMEPPAPAGMSFLRSEAPWMPSGLPGIQMKLLSAGEQQDYVMLLIELAAGAGYPEHDHPGVEDMYILSGDLQTEGRILGPGDSLHAEPGSHHTGLASVNGCTAIMVLPRSALASLPTAGAGPSR